MVQQLGVGHPVECITLGWGFDGDVERTTVILLFVVCLDCLCGLVIRVLGYRSRGPEFNYQRYHIFLSSLERGPFSLVRITEKLLAGRSNSSGLENRY
jgi:hypothetical protein